MGARTSDGKKPTYAAPAVDQALDIVEHLSRNARSYGISELARELGISTNMAFRVLKRLTARGYAELDPGGGYRLGARFFSLGMRLYHRHDLRLRARPHLELLCERTHETCQIHVPDKDRALALDCLSPQADFYLAITPGSRLYYHPNAFGKAILAFLPEAEVQALLPENLPALTPRTITTRRELMTDLEEVRRTGLAYDREEYNAGFFCIGSPVFGVTETVVAGIGITAVCRRVTSGQFKAWESLVLQCAARIAADIGYAGEAYRNYENTMRAAHRGSGRTLPGTEWGPQ